MVNITDAWPQTVEICKA